MERRSYGKNILRITDLNHDRHQTTEEGHRTLRHNSCKFFKIFDESLENAHDFSRLPHLL